MLGGRELISASMAAYGSVINNRQREQSQVQAGGNLGLYVLALTVRGDFPRCCRPPVITSPAPPAGVLISRSLLPAWSYSFRKTEEVDKTGNTFRPFSPLWKYGALRPQQTSRLIRDGEVGRGGILYVTPTRYTVSTRVTLR